MEPIRETKQLPADDWLGFFATFSTENRKHPVTVELIGPELGDQILFDGAPLMAVDYDPPDKGDNLVILARDELGRIEVIEVVDGEGARTLIQLN